MLGNRWRNYWKDFRVPGRNQTHNLQNGSRMLSLATTELQELLVSWVSFLGSSSHKSYLIWFDFSTQLSLHDIIVNLLRCQNTVQLRDKKEIVTTKSRARWDHPNSIGLYLVDDPSNDKEFHTEVEKKIFFKVFIHAPGQIIRITILLLRIEFLKWYCDENHIFSIEPILKHKQVACMTRKMLFTIVKYLFSFQRYLSF